eukprot:7460987-Alexandrium_andersonii.AAC.1
MPAGIPWRSATAAMTTDALVRWAEGLLCHLHVVCGSEHDDVRLCLAGPAQPRLFAAKDVKALAGWG